VPNSPDFGGRLRICRLAARLSQEELSAQSGVSVRAIGDLERGRTRWPHPGSVHRLADALRLTGEARAEFVSAARRRLPRDTPAKPGTASDGRVAPRQLPPTVPVFAGRSNELASLSHVLTRPGGTAVITAIGGTAGVGKTALALRWGHLVAAEFPDGQLYVNLRGFGPSGTPMSPGYAVRLLLEGLDVSPERLPRSEEAQLNLYRSLLVGKRMLIVLDNARDETQVRPLLPGSLTCRVLVTSRNLLAGLTALDAAHPLLLDVLTETEAWDLLEQRLGAERLHADDGAAYQLIKASACLPLALSIIAARAASRPDLSVTSIAAELTADRGLNAFTAGEPAADVRAVLTWSYRQLDNDAARAFRLAGLHPGSNLDPYKLAALTGMTLDQAQQALLALTKGGLIQRAGPDQYSMHDLLREYARELGKTHDSEPDQRTALTALFDFYLHTAYTASALMFPAESRRPPRVSAPATPVPPFDDHTRAREWLDSELSSLVVISGYTTENGWLSHAAEMSAVLYTYLHVGHHHAEAVTIHQHAVKAAARAGDHSAEGLAIIGLATVDYRQGLFLDAIERYELALLRFEEAGDLARQVRVRHSVAIIYQVQGQFGRAFAHLRHALAYYRETGDWVKEGRVLYDVGYIHLRLGRYRQASRCLHQSLISYQKAGDQRFEAHLLTKIGEADFRQGYSQQAADRWQKAVAIMRDRGDRRGVADVLRYQGMASMRRGDHEQTVSYVQESLAVSREIDHSFGEADALCHLGLARLHQGHHQAALSNLDQALNLARKLHEPELTATVLNGTGEALIAVGQPAQGLERYAEALQVATEGGDRYETARAHAGIGSAHKALGNHADAVRHWRLAHDAYVRMGAPEAEDIRHLLDK
jgi:tetratricopeptide (TPR) repeat protein/transcriptional regulator with XRE-family HTH domain